MTSEQNPHPKAGAKGGNAKDMHILIIGAGASGLLIAQGLKQANISFEIFERENMDTYTHRPRDWSMGLHWGWDHIRDCVPEYLKERLSTVSTDPFCKLSEKNAGGFPLVNGKTGDEIAWVSASTSGRVSRKRLRNLLAEGIDVQYGKKLQRVSDDGEVVRAHFCDGSIAQGTAIVGADGSNSGVRSTLLPPEQNQLELMPIRVYNFTQKFTSEQAAFIRKHGHPIFNYGVHPDLRSIFVVSILEVPDPDDPATWTFQIFFDIWGTSEHLSTSAERVAHLKSYAEHWSDPYRSIAHWIKDDTVINPDTMKHHPQLCRWENHGGRITLAGDAAHPMVAYRGQGLNNGMQDGATYVHAIKDVVAGRKTLSDAIEEYDEEMYRRGKAEIDISAKTGVAYHDWDRLMDSPVVTQGFHKIKK